MPSEPEKVAAPSVFISYASADRAAARALSGVLERAGLDVWLDEEELAGGEAWDAKIRGQIRACSFFLPVISATTEARREGYFRREWRLAVERTLDLADDVMFLLPIAIDDTAQDTARVPEEFNHVQWLRCPAGGETPALLKLADQLLTYHSEPLPPSKPTGDKKNKEKIRRPAPPFPDFPAFPHGHYARFVYDLVVWGGRLIYALWMRLPRWLQVVATVVIVFKVIDLIFGSGASRVRIEN